MTPLQTHAWIFLAIAMSAEHKPASADVIRDAADYLNHAVPEKEELEGTLQWLQEQDYITRGEDGISLSSKGRELFRKTPGHSDLMKTWGQLEMLMKESK